MSLHYVTRGDSARPAVVFLHGFMGSIADWTEILRQLEGQYYCIAVDLPGHGRSTGLEKNEYYVFEHCAVLLRDILDLTGVDRACIVGYSMGARVALYFGVRYPESCTKLLLESGSPGLEDSSDRLERRGSDEAMAVRLETEDFKDFLEDWYSRPLFETLENSEEMIALRESNDPRELARSLRGMGTGVQPSLWGSIPELKVPVLAIAGALDGKYVEIANRMSVLMPRVRTAIISNAGHNVHAERPKAYLETLRDFLAQAF